MLLTTPSSVSLYASVRIVVLNALFGGPIVENTKNQHLEQKNLSEQPWSVEKMVRIPSTSIWRVFGRFTHPSGQSFCIPTYSWRLHLIFCINYIREFSRTILSNGVLVLSEKKLSTLNSVPCPPIQIYTISKKAFRQSCSGLEKSTKKGKRFFLVSLLVLFCLMSSLLPVVFWILFIMLSLSLIQRSLFSGCKKC